jgi:caa(3)-type oxidase subunit IV
MDALIVTLWIAAGAFIGGVVTPVVAENKRIGDWLAMLVGMGVGAIFNVVLLIPLWLAIWRFLPNSGDTRLRWERDTISLEQARAAAGQGGSPVARLRQNFWPAARAGGHSRRATYMSVFAALALLTATEVLLTVVDAGFSVTGPLVALSTAKVLLVAMFFMHLRYDSRWYSAIFVYTVPFAVAMTIILALAAAG